MRASSACEVTAITHLAYIDSPSNWGTPLRLAHAATSFFHCRRGAVAPISCDGTFGLWRHQGSLLEVNSVWSCDGRHDVQQAHLKLLAYHWREFLFGGKRTWGMHMNAPSRRKDLGQGADKFA